MKPSEHWRVTQLTPQGGERTLHVESTARAEELIREVIEARGMARVGCCAGRSTPPVTDRGRLPIDETTVVRIRLWPRPTASELRWRLREALGLLSETPRNSAVCDRLLAGALSAPFRVLVVHSFGRAQDECQAYARWLWENVETNLCVINEIDGVPHRCAL